MAIPGLRELTDEPPISLTGRWIWLFPTTLMLHIAEEGWAARLSPAPDR